MSSEVENDCLDVRFKLELRASVVLKTVNIEHEIAHLIYLGDHFIFFDVFVSLLIQLVAS